MLVSIVSCALAQDGWRIADGGLRLGYHGEAGVESKLVCAGQARASRPGLDISAGLAASLLQNAGVSAYGLRIDARVYARIGGPQLFASVLAQHEQWNDWHAGENRAGAMLALLPGLDLLFGLGAAYRAPVCDPARYASPFYWHSDQPEWNLIYDVRWRFLQQRSWTIHAFVANVGPLSLHNPQQVPFGLEAEWRLGEPWTVSGRLGTAVNGVSAPLLSLSEVNLSAGLRYAP